MQNIERLIEVQTINPRLWRLLTEIAHLIRLNGPQYIDDFTSENQPLPTLIVYQTIDPRTYRVAQNAGGWITSGPYLLGRYKFPLYIKDAELHESNWSAGHYMDSNETLLLITKGFIVQHNEISFVLSTAEFVEYMTRGTKLV